MGPTQALTLMNDKFVREQSRYLAERVLLEAAGGARDRVRTAYRLSLSRAPTETEFSRAVSFLDGQTTQYEQDLGEQAASRSQNRMRALVDFCQGLLLSNEFLYVD